MELWTKLCAQLGYEESIYRTLAVLGYQYGELQKFIVYSERHPEYKVAYRGEAKVSLADLLAQAEVLCERFGWVFEEMRELGHMRFRKSDEKDRRETQGQT